MVVVGGMGGWVLFWREVEGDRNMKVAFMMMKIKMKMMENYVFLSFCLSDWS